MFNFKKLITPDYLLSVNRVLLTRSDKLFFALGAVMVVLAIIFKLAAMYAPNPVDKIVREKFYRLFLVIGLCEVVWFGARTQFIQFFGSHFVAMLILLIALIWFFRLVLSVWKNYRADKQVWEKEQVRLKYLPKN